MSERKPRVAVLDDDLDFNELMKAVLAEEGYRYVRPEMELADPADALAAVRPDLAMLDLRGVGDAGGIALLERFRADPRHERLPVLICSADVHLLRDHAADLARTPRVAVLEKPFRIEALIGVIQGLLGGASRFPMSGGSPDPDATAALEAWLGRLGRQLRWAVVDAWVPDRRPGLLRCAAAWAAVVGLQSFADISLRTRLPVGAGLPGRIWMSERAAWIEDLAADLNFPRQAAARRVRLVSAAAVPVRFGGEVVGVVAGYDTRVRRPEVASLERLRRFVADAGPMLRAAAGRTDA